MSRPTIANLKLENALLRERLVDSDRIWDGAMIEIGKLKAEIDNGLMRESALRFNYRRMQARTQRVGPKAH